MNIYRINQKAWNWISLLLIINFRLGLSTQQRGEKRLTAVVGNGVSREVNKYGEGSGLPAPAKRDTA
jgi:hypothetical protein